jgi:hypothetical protein
VGEQGPKPTTEETKGRKEQMKDALTTAFYFAITHHVKNMTNEIVKYAYFQENFTLEELTEIYHDAFVQTSADIFKQEKDNGEDI